MSASVAERLAAIQAELPAYTRLLAVSKGHPAEAIRQLAELGQCSFGESRLQEASPKQAALADLRGALARTLGAFRPGPAGWLGRMLGRRRVSRLLFAATRADHLHHSQHARLAALLEALLSEARDRARFSGAEVHSLALAALRATVEETRVIRGQEVGLVRGRLLPDGRQVALHPGDLPADPRRLLSAMQTGAQTGAPGWPEGDYALMRFAPAVVALAPGDGPPHLRLDQAAEFLFGDRLT